MSLENLVRFRGDTDPIAVTITRRSTGAAVDLTGASAKLTIHALEEPDAEPETLQLAGVIQSPATDGLVHFTPTAQEADITPGVYFYDVEITFADSSIKTVGKASFTVRQDVTK